MASDGTTSPPTSGPSTPSPSGSHSGDASEATTTLPNGLRVTVSVSGKGASGSVAEAAAKAAGLQAAESIKIIPKKAKDGETSFFGIVGQSAKMMDLKRLLERIQGSNATVLVTGENGTGKELVAKAVHNQSDRAHKRFVATNCSAFNDNLLESELFGHRKGSFTGAVGDKPGLFEVADTGTFFMDEVGDMSPALQVKLLRVLQESVFMPVGGTEQKKVDVRIIAATNRDLGAMVKAGTFREDLYYRMHVVALRVPALRDRKDDIPILADHFMAKLAKRDDKNKVLSQRAVERLMTHDWPGNVRELENEIERLWVLSGDEGVIGEEHLTPVIRDGGRKLGQAKVEAAAAPVAAAGASLPDAVANLERHMISQALTEARGNKTRASEKLGISRRNLIRKVQAYDLESSWNKSGNA